MFQKLRYKSLVFIELIVFISNTAAQCPQNIGFETGNFQNWECYAGKVDVNGVINVALTGPVANRHTMIQNSSPQAKDLYGDFPINSPNGSKYSIKLGNDLVNSEAERISYTFTVPSNQNFYSIIYNYAVVFQNPGHAYNQQPRFTAKVFDVASNQYIDCSSFEYVASSSLPGFKLSPKGTNVYYKPWSPVTIKLTGYAGKTIRLEFTTNDCTLEAHFGYAYIDVNEDCSSPISGNTYCAGATSTILVGPFGFQEYRWYTADFSALLGTKNTLPLKPVPPPNTVYALVVKPFPGSGCIDTLYTTMTYTPVPFNFKVADSVGSCAPALTDLTSPSITAGSTPGLIYSYFIDSSQINYLPAPWAIDSNSIYYIKATNSAGCLDIRPVKVIISSSPIVNIHSPDPVYYPHTADITNASIVTGSTSALSYTYWKDASATIPLANPNAVAAGTFYIKATNVFGCSVIKPVNVIMKIPPPPNAFSPNGDGVHDLWEIPALNIYPGCRVNIYNRYGQNIFHSTGYSNPWNGKVNGKKLPVGTYYYVIKIPGQLSPISGYVDIIY